MNHQRNGVAFWLLALLALVATPSLVIAEDGEEDDSDSNSSFESRRGSPAEFDPGPPKDSRWPELFAATPNYRALGISILSSGNESRDDREKFRWTFGPMYYRGRLTPNSVKVLVIGQEGAQDESLSNRAFTGGTGAKMQSFLNHIGINRSYLFMNTFVYTINGQYTDQATRRTPEPLLWLAQNAESPLVQHRHEMLNYALETNAESLRLVIAVGTAAKDTLQTWVESRGGRCRNINEDCDSSVFGEQVQVLHVPHPGAASPRNGGEEAARMLVGAFARAAEAVSKWESESLRSSRTSWLEKDEGSERELSRGKFTPAYRYSSAPIPYADFAFGTTPRLGRGGTSSNRTDRQRSIQIFSAAGCYNALCTVGGEEVREPLRYTRPTDLESEIPEFSEGEIEWESPRARALEYDAGPDADMAALLMGEHPEYPLPDFQRLGVTQHGSLGHGQLYRGNFDNVEVLVVADQESNDDLFSGRALTGAGGQRLQTFLYSIGAEGHYLILRTIPVDTSDLSARKRASIAVNPALSNWRHAAISETLYRNRGVKLVIGVGPDASRALDELDFAEIPVVKLSQPEADGSADWAAEFRAVKAKRLSLSHRASSSLRAGLTAIPRADLPVHTKWWVGTSGTRSARAQREEDGERRWDGNYYKFFMPDWVAELEPKDLSRSEQRAVRQFQSRR